MNLVVNARDAMLGGGMLRVETDRAEVTDSFARSHPGLATGTYVRLTVSDSGIGMAPDVLGQIFTPFFTTKGPVKGTGLGLATVHGIVEQANGYIGVNSAPGQGSTFSVYLPHVNEPVEPVEAIEPPVASAATSETILLVEDDDSVRLLGARVLRQEGYTVLPARHAEEAIDLAAAFEGTIDLLLTDVVMPGLDGSALAQRLRQSRASTKVLYASGYTDDVGALRDIQSAGAHFLRKPYTPKGLTQSVRRVLYRSQAPR